MVFQPKPKLGNGCHSNVTHWPEVDRGGQKKNGRVALSLYTIKLFYLFAKQLDILLELFRKAPNLRVLACGGDGTVGWILSVLDQINITPAPPVGVLLSGNRK
ncbi:unnamed protein product [Timema podura]|uniref:DAGKc domain-containing protein n=1 Tax=Timema podura TaxID=61482 RepID=A0ABN7NI15_TIMPD|nr:unnamed protein product [Timema podura]